MLSGDALLYILQVTSASFPSGSFAHSAGFETLVASKQVEDAESLERFVHAWIEFGLAPADGVAVALAHDATNRNDIRRLAAVDEVLGALKTPRETYDASVMSGRATLRAVAAAFGGNAVARYSDAVAAGQCAGHVATAFGVCAAAHSVPRDDSVLAFIHASVANVVGVVGRLVPLGQSDVQRILAGTRDAVTSCTAHALNQGIGGFAGMTTFLDVASMNHERLTMRLCIS